MGCNAWPEPASFPALAADETHVWRVHLDRASDASVDHAHAVLDAAERARAARYRLSAPRRQFVLMRGALRRLLARYLGTTPQAVALTAAPGGKPRLADPAPLAFNVSHSGGLGVAAVSRCGVGVDVEQVRADVDAAGLAARFLTPGEAAWAGAGHEAFFECWTLKEAYLKARGEGIARGLASFETALAPDGRACVRWDARDPDAPARWRLEPLAPAPGYTGALAHQTDRMRRWTFSWH